MLSLDAIKIHTIDVQVKLQYFRDNDKKNIYT